MERTVLLAVPEPDTAAVLEEAFAFHGYRAVRAPSGADALAAAQDTQHRPDLVVMDLSQPDVDGLILCADLRERVGAPIIVCGGSEESERRESLLAFRLGADDFVCKPFDVEDVVARSEAAVRRAAGQHMSGPQGGEHADAAALPTADIVELAPVRPAQRVPAGADAAVAVGALALDQAHHRVTVAGREVKLSRSEYLLLGALMSRPDELLSRLDLARAVWGEQLARVGRPIDQHMYRLRAKLQSAARAGGVEPPTIVSVPGFGYRLMAESEAMALRKAS
jgi:DNA-binding response OmpR family regulator